MKLPNSTYVMKQCVIQIKNQQQNSNIQIFNVLQQRNHRKVTTFRACSLTLPQTIRLPIRFYQFIRTSLLYDKCNRHGK
jgi:hypothetical protein